MAAFFASPGPSQNLEAARAILDAMASSGGRRVRRTESRPRRVLAVAPDAFPDLLARLIADEDPQVAAQAINAAGAATRDDLIEPLIAALARPELSDDAARALALYRDAIVPELERRLQD